MNKKTLKLFFLIIFTIFSINVFAEDDPTIEEIVNRVNRVYLNANTFILNIDKKLREGATTKDFYSIERFSSAKASLFSKIFIYYTKYTTDDVDSEYLVETAEILRDFSTEISNIHEVVLTDDEEYFDMPRPDTRSTGSFLSNSILREWGTRNIVRPTPPRH